MSGTPAINGFLGKLVTQDEFLRANGFTLLQEVAAIGFRNDYYEAAIPLDTPYKKMFSALWRESPLPQLKPGERLMTMAVLLHVDKDGHALLPELTRRSGLRTVAWLGRYLQAYLTPLLHCFYAYDLVFMPHGENLILVLDGYVPDQLKLLGIFIDVFDGVLRHLNQMLVENNCCADDTFWRAVADCVHAYEDAQPQYAAKYAQHDMFAPEFLHSCLNRLQLGNNMQMVNLSDPASGLKMAGFLENPIAGFRRARRGQGAGGRAVPSRVSGSAARPAFRSMR